jgi:methionine-rich copper-binding protein CopC
MTWKCRCSISTTSSELEAALVRLAYVLLLSAALCGDAYAHASLLQASPAADSIISAAPQEVALAFTDTLEAAFSSLRVTDENGVEVSQGKA